MDYRKTIKLYEEDGKTVMCDFDIVLNRSMGLNALRSYPELVDAMFNGETKIEKDIKKQLGVEDEEPQVNESDSDIVKLFKSGKAEMLFAFTDYFPPLIADLFPAMLDNGEIRVGNREEILELVRECLVFDTDFMNGMIDFFTTACVRVEKRKNTRKIPKFTMH